MAKGATSFVSNLKTELADGKPKVQALAVAYSEKRSGKKRKKKHYD